MYRVHDSLGVRDQVHHATTQELMAAGPRDPWAFGNLPSDAASKPTGEAIEAFYKNALRSSGSRSQATDKTKRMFDLADLKVDANGTVLSFKVADHARDTEATPPTEPQFNQGNTHYVLTLPPGNYSAEDGDDFLEIIRTEEGHDPALVAAVPKGAYRIEADPKTGHQHLYRLPDSSVPERVPLSDMPIRVGDHGVMANALRRMNKRMQRFYTGLGKLNY